MGRKYYEAYDDRYRQVRKENLLWFDDAQTGVVVETIPKYLLKNHSMLELGCGERRDAIPLLNCSFNLMAKDISAAAIDFCRKTSPELLN